MPNHSNTTKQTPSEFMEQSVNALTIPYNENANKASHHIVQLLRNTTELSKRLEENDRKKEILKLADALIHTSHLENDNLLVGLKVEMHNTPESESFYRLIQILDQAVQATKPGQTPLENFAIGILNLPEAKQKQSVSFFQSAKDVLSHPTHDLSSVSSARFN